MMKNTLLKYSGCALLAAGLSTVQMRNDLQLALLTYAILYFGFYCAFTFIERVAKNRAP